MEKNAISCVSGTKLKMKPFYSIKYLWKMAANKKLLE